jgi:hypothetical protein
MNVDSNRYRVLKIGMLYGQNLSGRDLLFLEPEFCTFSKIETLYPVVHFEIGFPRVAEPKLCFRY